MNNEKKKWGLTIFAAIIVSLFSFPQKAYAEEIPVLTWERGQVQNIVLGQDSSNNSWEIYLKSAEGRVLKSSKSLANSDNFLVYSFAIPSNFPTIGYVVEAKNSEGDTKQVAGVQIVAKTSNEVTRAPLELFLILLGLSIFFYLINFSKNRKVELDHFSSSNLANSKSFEVLQSKIYFQIQKNSKQSLIKALLLEELKLDFKFAKFLNIFGLLGIVGIMFLQFTRENWILGNSILIIAILFIGNLSITYGLILMSLSALFLILNISLTKTFAEVLAIFILSSIFVAPNIYNQFIFKILRSQVSKNLNLNFVALVSALIAALAGYEMMLLLESLSSNLVFDFYSKEIMALFLLVFFTLKNYVLHENRLNFESFTIVRAISPVSSLIVAILIGAIIYIWTTNQILLVIAGGFSFLILSASWLKLKFSLKSRLRQPDPLFVIAVISVVIFSIYLALKSLPLDVINRSHLNILLIFPIDFLLAAYLLFIKSEPREAETK